MSLSFRLRKLASSDPLALANHLDQKHFKGDLPVDDMTLKWSEDGEPYAEFQPPHELMVSKPWWDTHDEDARERLILHELIHLAVWTLYGPTMWRAQHKDRKGHGTMYEAVRRKYHLQDVRLTSDDLA